MIRLPLPLGEGRGEGLAAALTISVSSFRRGANLAKKVPFIVVI
jgi:hypothetical protein